MARAVHAPPADYAPEPFTTPSNSCCPWHGPWMRRPPITRRSHSPLRRIPAVHGTGRPCSARRLRAGAIHHSVEFLLSMARAVDAPPADYAPEPFTALSNSCCPWHGPCMRRPPITPKRLPRDDSRRSRTPWPKLFARGKCRHVAQFFTYVTHCMTASTVCSLGRVFAKASATGHIQFRENAFASRVLAMPWLIHCHFSPSPAKMVASLLKPSRNYNLSARAPIVVARQSGTTQVYLPQW
jgi:hypothetical protein